VFHHLEFLHHEACIPLGFILAILKIIVRFSQAITYYTLKLVEKFAFFIALIFLFKYRYLPVFGIGVLGITVYEKVGIFAIPNQILRQQTYFFRICPEVIKKIGHIELFGHFEFLRKSFFL
jgi:hypothetical protein